MTRFGFLFAASIVVGSTTIGACSHYADECENTSTCPPDGGTNAGGSTSGSAGKGGTTGGIAGRSNAGEGGSVSGGSSSGKGGGGTTADGGGSDAGAGGSLSQPCDGACTAPNPVCDEPNHACVECLEEGDCAAGAKKKCDTTTKACVECLASTECSDAKAAKCDGGACVKCTTNDDCAHIAGKTVCDTTIGECVECTGKDYASCGISMGTPLVCDTLERTCTNNKEHTADLCKPCVSDSNCKEGEICAAEKYDGKDVGYFCFWKQGDTAHGAPGDCFTDGNPYAGVQVNAKSIDGATADICTLRSSSCVAVSQFSTKNCKPDAVPDNSLCGFAPPKDAKCDQVAAGANYRCTMTCLSTEDCPGVSTCNPSTFVCDL